MLKELLLSRTLRLFQRLFSTQMAIKILLIRKRKTKVVQKE